MLNITEIKALIAALRRTPEAVLMDTEQTCQPGSWERRKAGAPLPTDLREVIQIGAVTVETRGFTVLSTFETIVKPKINPVLDPFCVALTGVTQARVDTEGVPFGTALKQFNGYVGDRPVVVYNADAVVFAENVAINDLDETISDYMRLKECLERCGVDMTSVNSGKIATRLGSTKTYREHDALADVTSMADGLAILAAAADGTGPVPN